MKKKSKAEAIAMIAGGYLRDLRKDEGNNFHYILTILSPKDPFEPDSRTEGVTVSSILNAKTVQQTMCEMSEGTIVERKQSHREH